MVSEGVRREVWPRGVESGEQMEGLASSRVRENLQTDGREYRRDGGLGRKMEKV